MIIISIATLMFQVFTGPLDRYTLKLNVFAYKLKSKYFKLCLKELLSYVHLRLELYGCDGKDLLKREILLLCTFFLFCYVNKSLNLAHELPGTIWSMAQMSLLVALYIGP